MMSRCKVCQHPDREGIEKSLDLGWSLRAVGERFGISSSTLSRHRRNHSTATRERNKEIARLRQEKAELEHLVAVRLLFSKRAGWSTSEKLAEGFERICIALAAREDWRTLVDWMRAFDCAEGDIWSVLEEEIHESGGDPGEVWAQLYAPDVDE